MPKILVAGVGNMFLGDDAFGVEVVRRLGSGMLPADVRAADFGIRGIHLAYELLDGRYSDVILVDAVSRGSAPGTLVLMDLSDGTVPSVAGALPANAHGMSPAVVLEMVRGMVADPPRCWLVGCEPGRLDEDIGLSDDVQRSVGPAVDMVQALLVRLGAGSATEQPPERTPHA